MFEVSEKPVSNGRCGSGDQALFLLDLAQLEDLDCSSQLQKQSFLFLFCSESGRERKRKCPFSKYTERQFYLCRNRKYFHLAEKNFKKVFSSSPDT